MMTKVFVLLGALVAVCSAGVAVAPAYPAIPAALTVGTYASSYNAHAINHAIAAPLAPLTYSAYPAYSALPVPVPATYSAAYSTPIIAGRR